MIIILAIVLSIINIVLVLLMYVRPIIYVDIIMSIIYILGIIISAIMIYILFKKIIWYK